MNKTLQKIHKICISKNLHFATYRLPGLESSTTFIQVSNDQNQWKSILDFCGHEGFVMSPFDTANGARYLLVKPEIVLESSEISAEQMRRIEQLPDRSLTEMEEDLPFVASKERYMGQVQDIRTSISRGAFQKAVLSRITVIEGRFLPLIPAVFQTICRKHPNAFVYLFRSGGHCWIGASPEPLMRLRERRISTMSLAGTRPYAKAHLNVNRWTMKEVLEQEYVTRYIHDVLRQYNIRDYRVSSPYVRRAGTLAHLCTDFSFGYEIIRDRLWEFVESMHPTPAVAGHPKDDAIEYIKKLEPHDREYYTGFLGPVLREDTIDLFVNLRCMKITPRYMSLFVGGGITLESDPEGEWNETRWKADGLISILQSYIKKVSAGDET